MGGAAVSAIDRIKQKLDAHPDLRYRTTANSVEVEAPSPGGFSVRLSTDSNEYTVHFDGWHEHFESEADALNCFAYGLSGQCRLAVLIRGHSEVRFTLEHLEDGAWKADSSTGLLLQPFWRESRIEYRHNPRAQAF